MTTTKFVWMKTYCDKVSTLHYHFTQKSTNWNLDDSFSLSWSL